MKRTAWVLSSVGLALLLWAHEGHRAAAVKGIKLEKGRLSMQEANKKAIGLTHDVVDFRTMEETVPVNAVARVPWSARAYASTRLPGAITKVMARPGATVKAGDVLAELESVEFENLQIEAQQREADLKTAQENLALAEKAGTVIVPELELLPLRVAVEERKNALASAQMQLATVGLAGPVEKTTRLLQVKAPIDGTLLHVDLSTGRWVEPMEHLFEVLDLHEIWLEAEVPETIFPRVRAGQKARAALAAYPDRRFEGTVQRVGTQVDPDRHAVRVWISIANPEGVIRPGLYGRVDIIVARAEEIFAAPLDAIITDGAERFALVQNKDGSYRRANVILGRTDGPYAEIVEGLYPGDRVVRQGSHELADLYLQTSFTLSREAKKAIGLKFAEIDERPIEEGVELSARLRLPPENAASASARLEGKIERVLVSIGQTVQAGQPVAEIQSLELERAQMDLIREGLRLDLLRQQLATLARLQEKNIAPRKEIIRVQSEARSQESVIQNLHSRLASMGLSTAQIEGVEKTRALITRLPIPAPLSGQVTDVRVAVGQVVRPGEPVAEVRDRSRLWVEGYAFERDVSRILPVAAGQTAEARILALAGGTRPARIVGTSASVGEQDRVLQVWAELADAGGALPGMLAELRVSVAPGTRGVVAAPREALLEDAGRTWAFVEKKEGFLRVPVVTGKRDSHYVEIVRGLFPGDRVAVSGLDELNNAHSAVR